MHRFTTKATKKYYRRFPIGITYLMFPVLLLVFWLLLNSVSTSTVERQRDSLEKAINRDIIHCYALEGFYPPSLAYMQEHYGLTYDESLFFVDYQPIGANMRPDVTILVKP